MRIDRRQELTSFGGRTVEGDTCVKESTSHW